MSNRSSSKSIQNVDTVVDSYPYLQVDELEAIRANLTQATISYATISGGSIEGTSIGLSTPSDGAFTSLTTTAGDVTFNSTSNALDYMKWSSAQSLLDIEGRLQVRDGFQIGSLNVTGSSLLTTPDKSLEVGIYGQITDAQLKSSGTLNLAGPINQHNTIGQVSLYSHTRDIPTGGLFLDSATKLRAQSALRLSLNSKYDDIVLTTCTQPWYTTVSVVTDGTRSILTTTISDYALEGIYTGDIVSDGTDEFVVASVDDATGIMEVEGTFTQTTFQKIRPIGGRVILDVTKGVLIPTSKPLQLDGEGGRVSLVNDASDILQIHARNGMRLIPETGDISIPENIHLTFSTQHSIVGSAYDLTVSAHSHINLIAGTHIYVPTDKPIIFGQSTEYIKATNGTLSVCANSATLQLNGRNEIVAATQFGPIQLRPATSVQIPELIPIQFGTQTSISGSNDELKLNSTAVILCNAPKVIIPDGSSLDLLNHGTIHGDDLGIVVSRTLQINAPNTVINGDLVVTGTRVSLNTEVQTISDPVIELGRQSNVLDTKDRGVSFRYGVNKVGFFGFKQSTGKFTFIPNCTSYDNDIFIGDNGTFSMDTGSIQAGSIVGDPDLLLLAPNGYIIARSLYGFVIPVNSPFYFGEDHQTYLISGPDGAITCNSPELILNGLLSFGNQASINNGGINGTLFLQSDILTIGSASNTTQIRVSSDSFLVTSKLQSDILRIGAGSIFSETAPGSCILSSSDFTCQKLLCDSIEQGVWNGTPIALDKGGTNSTGPWFAGAITYINNSASFDGKSVLTFDDVASTVQLNGLLLSSTRLSIPSDAFAFVSSASSSTALFTFSGSILSSGTITAGTSIISPSGTFDAIGCGATSSSVKFRTSLSFMDVSSTIAWNSTEIVGLSSQGCLSLQSAGLLDFSGAGGILMNQGSHVTWLQSGSYITSYSDQSVEIHAPIVTIPSTINLGNSTLVSGYGGISISNETAVTLTASTIFLDGNVVLRGTSIFTNLPEIELESPVLSVGGGSLQTITRIRSNTNGVAGRVDVECAAQHMLDVGDEVTVFDCDSEPNIDGIYKVAVVVDAYTISIATSYMNITRDGTTGKMRTKWLINPSVDTGIELNYYSATAFIGLQNSSGRFILASKYTSGGTVGEYGDLQCDEIFCTSMTLSGNGVLNAGSCAVLGSNLQVTGGTFSGISLDSWTTSTTSLVQNLNAEYLGGKRSNAYLLADGSTPLTGDWNAGNAYTIACKTLTVSIGTPGCVPFIDASQTLAFSSAFRYDAFLFADIDVSSNQIVFANGQIPPEKIGTGTAPCNISGNAATTTNAIYTTDYMHPYTTLVRQSATSISEVVVRPGCVLGRVNNGDIDSIPISSFQDITSGRTINRVTVLAGQSMQVSVDWYMLYITVKNDLTQPDKKVAYATLDGAEEDGYEKLIYVYMDMGCSVELTLSLLSADGSMDEQRTLLFDRSGQSAHLAYDRVMECWFVINSGARCIN